MMKYLLCFCLTILIASCRDDEMNITKNGIISHISPIWKYDNIQTNFENVKMSSGLSNANLILEDKVLISGIGSDGYRSLMAVDLASGNELWQWSDVINNKGEIWVHNFYCVDNNFIFCPNSNVFNVNLDDGITKWKYESDNRLQYAVKGLDEDIFLVGQVFLAPDSISGNVQRGTILQGTLENFLYPDYKNSRLYRNSIDWITSYDQVLPIVFNENEYLLIKGVEQLPVNEFQAFLDLYDLTSGEWKYRLKYAGRQSSNGATQAFQVVDEKIYLMIGAQIVCHDLWTGEEIWARDFQYNLQGTGFTISGDHLVTNNQFGQLHCVDIHTGRDIWKIEHDKSGPIRIVNGILYYSGAGTNQIHARRLSDGSEVWRLDPGRYDGAEDFKPDIYAVDGINGEKGKIIVQTYGHAYCLEAFQ